MSVIDGLDQLQLLNVEPSSTRMGKPATNLTRPGHPSLVTVGDDYTGRSSELWVTLGLVLRTGREQVAVKRSVQ